MLEVGNLRASAGTEAAPKAGLDKALELAAKSRRRNCLFQATSPVPRRGFSFASIRAVHFPQLFTPWPIAVYAHAVPLISKTAINSATTWRAVAVNAHGAIQEEQAASTPSTLPAQNRVLPSERATHAVDLSFSLEDTATEAPVWNAASVLSDRRNAPATRAAAITIACG